jgi:MoxR-like ATPase
VPTSTGLPFVKGFNRIADEENKNELFERTNKKWNIFPQSETNYFLFRYNPKIETPGQIFGKRYHLGLDAKNHKKLSINSKVIWYSGGIENYSFWGHGVISNLDYSIEKHKYINFDNFSVFNPAPTFEKIIPKKETDSIREKIKNLPSFNNQHSILVITKEIYDEIINDESITIKERELKDMQLKHVSATELEEGFKEIESKLLIPKKKITEIINALTSGSHIILAGPIGTGKTELARMIPEIFWSTNEGQNENISNKIKGYYSDIHTATADWNTQDVIGGIVPKMNGDNVAYRIQDGCVTDSVKKNWKAGKRIAPIINGEEYLGAWSIIDEFNRADIDKAFGQLFTALRTREMKIPTDSISKTFDSLKIPKDYRIIGTLNTADKHYLFPLSDALKSRFAIIEIDVPEKKFKQEEIFFALKNATKSLEIKYDEMLDIENKKVLQGKSQELYESIHQAYNFLSFVREFNKLGTAILKILFQSLISGHKSGMNINDTLDSGINFCVIPQLEKLSEMELGAIKSMINGDIIEFLKKINKSNKRYNSSKVFTKILEFLGLNSNEYEKFTTTELNQEDQLWKDIENAITKLNSDKEKLPNNLEQTTKSLESLMDKSVI